MRIAYVLPDPGIPVDGVKGASVHVSEVCRAFQAKGCAVLLVAMRAVGDPPPGVRLVEFDPGPLPRGGPGELLRARAVADFLARAEPAVAAFRSTLIYERLSLFAGDGGALATRLGVPRLVEVNAPVAAERSRQFGLERRELAESLERRALAGATVIAVSQPLADWSLARGAVHAEVMANGADVDRWDPERGRDAAAQVRQAYGLEGMEVVGFVGSLKPWHGVEVLLDAARQLAAHRPRLHLLIVGDGPQRSLLQARVTGVLAGRVHFTGAVPSEMVPDYVGAFDVATAPYLPTEQFYFSPLKVVEAMAMARPVVASRFAPVVEMLGEAGLLVEPGSAAALAVAVAELLDDRRRAGALGQLARARAIEHHSWSAVVDRILALAGTMTLPELATPAPAPPSAHSRGRDR